LRNQGWSEDGLAIIQQFALDREIRDPLEAAAAYEREHPPPQPIKGGGGGDLYPDMVPRLSLPGGGMLRRDPREAERDMSAMFHLLAGHEEAYLKYMIPRTLREVRREVRDQRF
jgi:hypothetical protein